MVDPRIDRAVLDKIRSYLGVTDARDVHGQYDVYMKIIADSLESVHNIVLDKVKRLYGIKSTITMLVAKKENF